MTPREVVRRAVEFRRPPRLPIAGFGEGVDDYVYLYPKPATPRRVDGARETDEWQCVWRKTDQPNMGQVKGHPLADLCRTRNYSWPDPDDPRRYEDVARRLPEIRAHPAQTRKYCQTGFTMLLWERMHCLCGFENSMIALMDDDRRLHEVADRLVDFAVGVARNMHRLCGETIDEFGFTDDWGTQDDLQISPEKWREFFSPRYRRLFRAIHECGWRVNMHSCGKIIKLLPDLVEAGLDTINMHQPRLNGIEELGRRCAGRLCFATLPDTQKTLPVGDGEHIRAEAALLMRALGTPDGGFILADYGAAGIGAAAKTRRITLEAFRQQDPWRHGWRS